MTAKCSPWRACPGYDNNVFGPPVDTAALGARLAKRSGSPMLDTLPRWLGRPVPRSDSSSRRRTRCTRPSLPTWSIADRRLVDAGGHTFHNWSVLPPQASPAQSLVERRVLLQARVGSGPRPIRRRRQLGVGRPTGIDLRANQRVPRHALAVHRIGARLVSGVDRVARDRSGLPDHHPAADGALDGRRRDRCGGDAAPRAGHRPPDGTSRTFAWPAPKRCRSQDGSGRYEPACEPLSPQARQCRRIAVCSRRREDRDGRGLDRAGLG